jgi:hypothetical protein
MGMTVGSSRAKLEKQTVKLLEPGESIVAVAKMLPRGGGTRRAAGFLLFGILGAHAAAVGSENGKSGGMKAVRMEISFADGSTVSLEAVRPNTTDGESVARALETACANT